MQLFSELFKSLKSKVDKLKDTGFFWVFFSNVLCKIIMFCGGMIIVRILTKDDYGKYAYIINSYSMLMLIADMGCATAAIQFGSENHKNEKKRDGFFSYGYKMGMAFSCLTSLLIFISPFFYPFKIEGVDELTRMLFAMPFIVTTNSFILSNLRVKMKNEIFGKINIFTSFIHYIIILPLSYYFGVFGAVVSNYIINILVLLFSVAISRKYITAKPSNSKEITKPERKSFLKLAIASQVNNSLDHGLLLLDVFLIGVFIANSEVISSYKVATTIPAALAFIPASIMTYLVPFFSRHNNDIAWVSKNYKRLIAYSAMGNFAITAISIALGPVIIPLVFGSAYSDSVECFTILMIGYFFSSTFRSPSVNVIYTQRKVRVNIIITIITGISNCVLDVLLIYKFASVGAAIATTLAHIINSTISFGYMNYYIRSRTKQQAQKQADKT